MNVRLIYLSVLLSMALCASGESLYSTYLNGFAHFSHDSSAGQAGHILQIDNSTDAPIMVLDTIAHDPAASFRFVARFANLHNAEGKSYRYFLSPDYEYYHYIVGFASIFAGAILWWFVVTFFVNAVRSHFNVRSMWLINRIIGIIILLMSLFGFVMGLREYIIALHYATH